MFELITSLAGMQGAKEAAGFITVMMSGIVLMPMAYVLLGSVFTRQKEWEIPQEAYTHRSRRELI